MVHILCEYLKDRIKLFIFDLDGTLIDTSDRFYNVFIFLAEKYGLQKITRAEFKQLYKSNRLGEILLQVKQRFLPEFLRIYHDFKGECEKPFEGVVEALKILKCRKYLLSVVTGRIIDSELVRFELEKHGLKDLFDEVLANNLSASSKGEESLQKTNSFKFLIERFNLKPEECVVVGDYVTDIISGKRLGCWTIGVLSGGLDYNILKSVNPDFIIASVKDIPSLLKLL
ncbi:MAG: HAD family hydrolase [Candidatus Odinarchaeum yellowstonii]|uniref:HAD family hydrolase n=1 Tax=Odinarchaeota yellowstonii (strain LCB_4) TaxID=1841599 RepID=A0AAF0ICB3_ODILC|nr:MAG: HAD family hydrolase [Candidatus Odinarchaeum yellowstonii]